MSRPSISTPFYQCSLIKRGRHGWPWHWRMRSLNIILNVVSNNHHLIDCRQGNNQFIFLLCNIRIPLWRKRWVYLKFVQLSLVPDTFSVLTTKVLTGEISAMRELLSDILTWRILVHIGNVRNHVNIYLTYKI